MVAFCQILACDGREQAQIVIEVDDALEIQGVVEGRTGRVQLHETVERGDCLCGLARLVLGVGFVQLGLLRQRRSSGATFEFFE